MSAPRALISEILTESRLTGRLFLVVEGEDDKRFITQWLASETTGPMSDLSIITSDGIEVSWQQLADIGLSEGAKQRVVYVGLQIPAGFSGAACVADLDCGHLADRHQGHGIWWTDFPALESYGFEPRTLNVLNAVFLGERLPEGAEIVAELAPALMDLYRLRRHREDIEDPHVEKGFTANGWDIKRAVPPHVAARWDEVGAVVFEDARSGAYGHDVARALMAKFSADIKNRAKISDVSVLESSLRASILLSNAFADSSLAARIRAWAAV